MSTSVYPHLTVEIDTESWYDDLAQWYTANWGKVGAALQVHDLGQKRREKIEKWLVDHGYEFGKDYRYTSDTKYYFASDALASLFVLGNSQ